jgi:hypothetical protein
MIKHFRLAFLFIITYNRLLEIESNIHNKLLEIESSIHIILLL